MTQAKTAQNNYISGGIIAYNVALNGHIQSYVNGVIYDLSADMYIIIDSIFNSDESRKYYAMDGSITDFIKNKFKSLKDRYFVKSDNKINKVVNDSKYTLVNSALSSVKRGLSKVVNLARKIKPEFDFSATNLSCEETESLIKSHASDFVNKVEQSVYREISTNDYDPEAAKQNILRQLRTRTDSVVNAVTFVTENQSRKTFNIAVADVMRGFKLNEFRWIYTFRSKHQRMLHRDVLDGNIYSIDNPPIIQNKPDEVRGLPAQLPNCKCKMELIIYS